MTWTQTWFINGKLIAQAPCKAERIREEMHAPFAIAFFCPHCGDVWARRVIDPPTRWNAITHECPKHPAPRFCEPSGSVWINYNQEFLKNLPKEVLLYEINLRLEQDK